MVNWHKFFTSILDTISDGVFISDAVGTTLYVNQMYADLVGVPARELRGKNVRDLVSEGLFDLALNPEVVRTGKPATYMQKLKDGKNVVISGAPVFDDKGRVCLVVTFVRDETRLAELNEQTGEQRRLIKEINDKLAFVAQSQGRDLEPVFASSAMQSVALELKRYASTDATVLIMGETGVGKDVFARLTHRWSRRKDKILLKVDCGGISETLTESEIFGYVPGAFTGASSKGKPGYFEIADGSTIFLDEVGELPLSMQTRLLRVLQTGEFIRVGSSKVQKTDVRVVAATNMNLQQAIASGRFREDLYYRLSTVPITVPALRERPQDIPLLFRKFAADVAVQYRMPAVTLDPAAREMLMHYYWRGNIRQLKNVAEQISAIEQTRLITPDVLAKYLPPQGGGAPVMMGGAPLDDAMSTERELLYKVLFDMRADINDLKRMMSELMHNPQAPCGPVHDVKALLPTTAQSSAPVYAAGSVPVFAESEEVTDEPPREMTKADMQREQIIRALRRNNGRRREAAAELFMSERTLYRKIKELGIEEN